MGQCVQTLGCNTQVELLDMQQNLTRLKQAADAFQQQGSLSGAPQIISGLDYLERQVSVPSARHAITHLQDHVCTQAAFAFNSCHGKTCLL